MDLPDANIEKLLACVETSTRVLDLVEWYRTQDNPFPSLSPSLSLDKFWQEAIGTFNEANELTRLIGGIPVKIALETGELKVGVITGFANYEGGVLQSSFLALGARDAIPIVGTTTMIRNYHLAALGLDQTTAKVL